MTFEEKLHTYSQEFEKMPGVTVIHDLDGFKPVYMTKNGLDLLGLSLEELISIKEDYQKLFFNRDFMEDFLQELRSMIFKEGHDETFTFFHQVKIKGEFHWYAASIKVFEADDKQTPTHTITYALPIEDFDWTVKRAQKVLEETEFARKNIEKFSSLSKRELQVLSLAGRGNKIPEIAKDLNVSYDTVNSHLKSIKRKLKSRSSFDLIEYAMAYDLL